MKKEYRISATIIRGRVGYDAETFECSYAKRCIDCEHLLSIKPTGDGVVIRCVVREGTDADEEKLLKRLRKMGEEDRKRQG